MKSFYRYLPIDDTLFHDGFYVTGAGRTAVPAGAIYPSPQHPPFYHFDWNEGRTLPEFAIILITKGEGVFEGTSRGPDRVSRGNVIFLLPGLWHRYRPNAGRGWTEKWVQFNGHFVHKLWDREILPTHKQILKPLRFRELEGCMDELLTTIEKHPGYNSLRYSLQVSHLLDLVTEGQSAPSNSSATGGTPSPGHEMIEAAQSYIWTHSQFSLGVRNVSSHLGVSRRTLERRFRAAQHRTVAEEIAMCRYNRAKRLLEGTDLPIKQVVYLAGFGKAENMRLEFKKHGEVSPSEYRARARASAGTRGGH